MALHIIVDIVFDSAKRDATLRERGLDFARAAEVFADRTFTQPDQRIDYGEERVIVWTWRGHARRIISMRKANEREQARYESRLG